MKYRTVFFSRKLQGCEIHEFEIRLWGENMMNYI